MAATLPFPPNTLRQPTLPVHHQLPPRFDEFCSNFRFKIRFWSNLPCFDELFSQLPVTTSTSGSGASGSKLHLALTSFFSFLSRYWCLAPSIYYVLEPAVMTFKLISFENLVLATYDHLAN